MLVQVQKHRPETHRAKLRALLCPMRRLSNEILLNILQYACKENFLQSYPWVSNEHHPTTTLKYRPITYLPTMVISSVCSRWRTLALSTPCLWANLKLEACIATPDQAKSQAGFVDTVARYLERSVDCPLSLALDLRGSVYKGEFPSLVHLAQHAQRWKSFEYNGSYTLEFHKILSQLQFPSLVELAFKNWVGLGPSDLDRFEYSPRLSALHTTGVPKSKIPYNQLHHLEFSKRSPPVRELAEALHSCPSVKSLALDLGLQPSDTTQGTWRNITSLMVMEKTDKSKSNSDIVFSSFDFPSLNVLHVQSPENAKEWPGNAFISFVSRSSCVITTFALRGLSLSDLDLIAAIRVMPSLLHLKIDDALLCRWDQRSPITAHLISSLQHRFTSTSLVPKLHSLHLISRLSQTFNDRGFIRMIESRWFKPGSELSAAMLAIGRACMRSVVLKFDWREVDAEVYEPLRILDEAGLRVVVSGTNGVQV